MSLISKLGELLTVIGADVKYLLRRNTAAFGFRAFNDCIANSLNDAWTFTVSGTGAAFSTVAPANNTLIGVLRLALGTVATNRGSIAAANLNCLRLGNGVAVFKSRHAIVTLSDATNTYTVRAGFIDSITGEVVDGAFFRYTNGVNSGKWQAVTRSNNTETASDTGVTAVAATWDRFEVIVNAGGTSVEFRINGAVVATITTNIPTGAGRDTGYGAMVLRSVGVAAVNAVDFDYVEAAYELASTR